MTWSVSVSQAFEFPGRLLAALLDAGGKVASLTLMAGGSAEMAGAKAGVAQPLPGLT